MPARSAVRDEAFARWVLPEIEVLYRVALAMTAQPADAEDLVQDTLIRAYRAVDRFDGAHPRAWLLTILRNTQRNRVRRRLPWLLREPDRELDQAASRTPVESPEDEVMSRSFDAVVEVALARLPERFRLVVQLVDLDGLSYAETATVLGIPAGTVMSRLHRARARIRTALQDAGYTSRRTGR